MNSIEYIRALSDALKEEIYEFKRVQNSSQVGASDLSYSMMKLTAIPPERASEWAMPSN
jgi:hypothetical protein